MHKEKKLKVVAEYKEIISSMASLVVTEYRGLTVGQMTEMRDKLREGAVTYRVIKNNLFNLALGETPLAPLGDKLEGPLGIAYSTEDPVAAPKAIVDVAKKLDLLVIRAGALGGKVLDIEAIKAMSKLPGKDEVRASFLSVLNGASQKFVNLLATVPRQFVNVLAARKHDIEENASE